MNNDNCLCNGGLRPELGQDLDDVTRSLSWLVLVQVPGESGTPPMDLALLCAGVESATGRGHPPALRLAILRL